MDSLLDSRSETRPFNDGLHPGPHDAQRHASGNAAAGRIDGVHGDSADAAAADGSADVSALAWVHDELRRLLEQAHKTLRRVLRETAALAGADVDAIDPGVLRNARAQLHQGVGALELIGMPEAATVLRASETALHRCAAKPSLFNRALLDAIERLSFALIDYLGRLRDGKPVQPLSLFPQYRAVQEAVGAERVHPADLWRFDWEWRRVPVALTGALRPRAADADARGAMEPLMLALMRQPVPAAFQRMSDLCAELAAGASNGEAVHPAATLWALAAAVFEGQAGGRLSADVFSKRVASRLLAQLRVLERGQHDIAERLAQDLLFFCAQAHGDVAGPADDRDGDAASRSPRLAAVRRAYGLPAAAGVDYSAPLLGRFDPAWIAQARKRVAAAKESWSAVAGGEQHRLTGLAEQFALVGDSLHRLFPSGDALAAELQHAVGGSHSQGSQPHGAHPDAAPPSPALAMEVATALLYVDAVLEDGDFDDAALGVRVRRLTERIAAARGAAAAESAHDGGAADVEVGEPLEGWMEELYRRVSDRQTMGSVVRELRTSLAAAETLIDQFFRQPQGDAAARAGLADVPAQLAAMRGVMSVLGLDHAVAALLRMRDDVDGMLETEVDPATTAQAGVFDRLAGNLGALGFLIDMLGVQPQLAKSLFVFDPASGTLNPVMGRGTRPIALAPAGEVAAARADGAGSSPSPLLPGLGTPAAADAASSSVSKAGAVPVPSSIPAPVAAEVAAPTPSAQAQPAPASPRLPPADAPSAEFTTTASGTYALDGAPSGDVEIDAGPRAATGPDGAAPPTAAAQPPAAAGGEASVQPPATAATAPQPAEADAPGADDEMRGIFLEEAGEVLRNARDAWQSLPEADDPLQAMTALRRAFHTLKGSARMVGLGEFGEAAWACEQWFNERLAQQAGADEALLGFTGWVLDELAAWVDDIAAGRPSRHGAEAVRQAIRDAQHAPAPAPDRLAPPSDPEPDRAAPALADDVPGADASALSFTFDAAPPNDAFADTALSFEFDSTAAPQPAPAEAALPAGDAFERISLLDFDAEPAADAAALIEPVPEPEPEPESESDAIPVGSVAEVSDEVAGVFAGDEHVKVIGPLRIGVALFNIYLNEADELSRRLGTELAEWSLEWERPVPDSAVALAHSLAGNSATVGYAELSQLARSLEHALARSVAIGGGNADEAVLFVDAADEIRHLLHQFAAGFLKEPSAELLRRLAAHEFEAGQRLDALSAPQPLDSVSGVPVAAEPLLAEPAFVDTEQPAFETDGEGAAEPASAQPQPDAPREAAVGAKAEAAMADLLLLPLAVAATEPPAVDAGFGLRVEPPSPPPPPATDFGALPAREGELGFAELKPLSALLPAETNWGGLDTSARPAGRADEPPADDAIDAVDAIDDELFGFFEEEGQELLPELAARLRDWGDEPGDAGHAAGAMRTLHTLKGGARLAGAMRLGELAHRLESGIEHAAARRPEPSVADIEALQARADTLVQTFDALCGRDAPAAEPAAAPAPEPVATAPVAGSAMAEGTADSQSSFTAQPEPLRPAEPAEPSEPGKVAESDEPSAPSEPAPAVPVPGDETAQTPPPAPDAAAAPTVSEADPGGIVEAGADAPSDSASADRAPIGEAALVFDAPFVEAPPADDAWPPAAPADVPAQAAESTAAMPSAVGTAADTDATTAHDPTTAHRDDTDTAAAAAPDNTPAPSPAADDIDWSRFAAGDAAATLPSAPGGSARQAPQTAVRVRAPLLDRLVNQSGEISITRARVESELKQFKGSLADLTDNLERLRGQLRDIEIQGETQMSSRLEAAKAAAQGFDPLEFDRFTRFQEVTRMMAESVNDVATVQRALQRSVQGTEDALAAQARLVRDLQDDLLRTRMVEFEGASDRLYRVVRQAAKETGKQVRLDITGGSIEIDRGVLDRMAGAFEHLLRNSVAHGIELPAVRAAAGKPPVGQITLTVGHEGNEVAVEVRDDGAGLDLGRIRAKGEALGLVQPGEPRSDAELANLIFAAGFSTADRVTELAGRGVGMDVVRADVNAIGGRIETATEAGAGTAFKLVLPLTTAVTQVVMLRCATLTVAVPSTLVEVVLRLPVNAAEAALERGSFEHAGHPVPYFWLGALLESTPRPGDGESRTRAVVVVRSASQRVAVQVDEVLGNQEVVVKNLGPQLSRMPGLAGVTLLASGAVALIYNPVALATLYGAAARAATSAAVQADRTDGTGGGSRDGRPLLPSATKPAAPEPPLILVVDDSLTVRRVTQRLLEREGYRVTLAKDGLDALERLAEEKPALVLSDIEMPRMDGFDLVRNIRGDARWRDLTVVMITSRIAQKHRDHAAELGVDHYLGKPYDEQDLLALLSRYTSRVSAG